MKKFVPTTLVAALAAGMISGARADDTQGRFFFQNQGMQPQGFAATTETGSPAAPIEGRFQHTDLLPSILQLADSEVCISPTQGLLFAQPPQPAEVTAHASGLNREQVQVFSARGQGRLVLDGDDTRWEDVPPPYADELLAAWSLDRIDRGPVRANRLEYLWGLLGYDRERAADPQD